MKALVFHYPKHVSVDVVKDPVIEQETDAIIKVTSTAICGSDLHIYNGFFPQTKDLIMGHEFMGIVEEVGKEVKKLKKGDRVVVPFPVACGVCWFCSHCLPTHCENSNSKNYGPGGGMLKEKGGSLFGYTDLYGGYRGGQAEYVRVPYADVGLRLVPDDFSDEQVLFLTDIFPTGYTAVDWAKLKGGEIVAVFGCGPVGLMAQKSAWIQGASKVIALDVEDYRLQKSKEICKTEIVHAGDEHAIDMIREHTERRGADVCIDAVGMEANRDFLDKLKAAVHLERGSIKALRMCLDAVRRGGFVSVVGVYGYPYDNFPLYQVFEKEISLHAGQAPVHNCIDQLFKLVKNEKVKLNDIISHHLPLDQAAHGYKIFNNKEDKCIKVVLHPD